MRAGATTAALLGVCALALGGRALHVLWREAERARVRAGQATVVPADTPDPELRRLAARRAELAGDPAIVAAHLGHLVWQRPLDAASRLRLGAALAALGDVDAASAQIRAAARLARNDPNLLVHAAGARIAIFRASGDIAELQAALRGLREALRRDATTIAAVQQVLGDDLGTPDNLARVLPDTPEAWRAAAAHFRRREQWEAAVAAYGRAGSLGGEPAAQALARASVAARTGDGDATLAACAAAVRDATAGERPAILASAVGVLRSLPPEWHDAGLARAAAWAEEFRADPAAALALARWQAQRQDWGAAFAVLASLPAAQRERSDVLALLARLSAQTGQAAAAGDYFRRAVTAEAGNPARWVEWIRWLAGQGRTEEALSVADRARARHPTDADIATVRRQVLERSVRGK